MDIWSDNNNYQFCSVVFSEGRMEWMVVTEDGKINLDTVWTSSSSVLLIIASTSCCSVSSRRDGGNPWIADSFLSNREQQQRELRKGQILGKTPTVDYYDDILKWFNSLPSCCGQLCSQILISLRRVDQWYTRYVHAASESKHFNGRSLNRFTRCSSVTISTRPWTSTDMSHSAMAAHQLNELARYWVL